MHPETIRLLQSLGYDVSSFRSKSWSEFTEPGAPRFDFVFTVCDNAAGRNLPGVAWPADDGALGHTGPRRSDRHAGRDRARLQGSVSDARAAHQHFRLVAVALARSAEPAKETARNRPPATRPPRQRPSPREMPHSRSASSLRDWAPPFCWRRWSAPASWPRSSRAATVRWRCSATPCRPARSWRCLILTFGPISGAHFNPAVSIAFALRRRTAVHKCGSLYRHADCRRHCRGLGRARDVRSAAVATLAHRPHRAGPVAC